MESPAFFKRAQAICVSLGAGAAGVRMGVENIPAYMEKPLEYCVVAGIIGFIMAKLPVKNPEDIHKPNDCGK